MAMSMGKRVTLAVAGAIVLLVVIALGGLYFVQHEVKERVAEALAPLGTAERIDVGFSAITLRHVRLTAPGDWPTPEAFTADEITMTPDIRDLLAQRVHLQSVVVRGFSLVVVRTASGRLEILPKLRQTVSRPGQPASEASSAAPNRPPLPAEKLIDHIAFADGQFVFYDEMIRKPPYKVTVSDANASVDHIHLPDLTEPTSLSVKGLIKGPTHTGTVTFDGWMKIASKDSQTTTTLRGVDVVTLDPYLLKKAGAKTQVTGGTLDLNLQATVTSYHIHAPGTVTLHHLQLAATDDPLDTFMQIPARAAVAALKQHGDDITLHFVIDGNLRDPKFKLNESVMTELRANFAKALGVSAEGVAKGAGETVKGLGNALKNLLGQ
ncbi:DUF748 domain-containing protein [Paraburkholderia hospita]|uniref:DUF748 domain-containing protein n=1 Tax=Paraburkholderia hospita TaxID=169430 RepID=A0AAN1MJT7_9BURK|nr:DUF748 domain-containing protein [Paraburkholderia hospita]AUT69655.1 DUF748 domain-containing protein [Paraburkholderia hospita]OUL88048.1 hypothetical protein CA601_19795 [Paraburkholderia hospita]SEI28180.1 protein of unknown function [Paraburkholderia hospita]SOE62289.1 protein of unknown function [Burkholderia sp. YR290]